MIKSDKWIRRQCEQQLKFELIIKKLIPNEQSVISIENNFSVWQIKENIKPEELEGFTEFYGKVLEAVKNTNLYKFEPETGEAKLGILTDPAFYEAFKLHRTIDNIQYEYFIKFDADNTIINTKPMISPFVGRSVKFDKNDKKIPSYGLSSFGYDIRLGRNIKIFKESARNYRNKDLVVIENTNGIQGLHIGTTFKAINPSDFDPAVYTEYLDVDSIVIPPGGFLLGHTVEYFNMPRRVMGICMGKSTLARCGLGILVTPLEPSWSGYLTLEIVNHTKLPVKIQTETGICQINFLESDEDCEVSYADRGGKYQNQPMLPVDPKV